MARKDETTIIKKYANRRLYNTGTSTYVTLEDLADMVKNGEDFVVQDAKSADDITHAVLTQIIFEQEGKSGQNMLPIPFLRQLISFYGDQMQTIVPSYLEHSMAAFGREQERLREQMTQAIGMNPLQIVEETTRRNMEMFQNAMRMFTPFGEGKNGQPEEAAEPVAKPKAGSDDLKTMRDQIAAMQRKLDEMG